MNKIRSPIWMWVMGIMLSMSLFAQGPPPTKLEDGKGNELKLAASGVGYDSTITTLPNASTLLTASKTSVQLIFCSNVSGSSATFTITDNQGSPITYFNAISLTANQAVLVFASAIGLPMQGIKWSSGTSNAINCQIVGVQ